MMVGRREVKGLRACRLLAASKVVGLRRPFPSEATLRYSFARDAPRRPTFVCLRRKPAGGKVRGLSSHRSAQGQDVRGRGGRVGGML